MTTTGWTDRKNLRGSHAAIRRLARNGQLESTQLQVASTQADIFTAVSKDNDFCIKPRQYETSIYGSGDSRDRWFEESDPFDTGEV